MARRAIDVGKSGEQGSSDTQPIQGIKDLCDKEYHTADGDFDDVSEKPAQPSKTEHSQRSEEAPGQNARAKAIQFAPFKRLPQETQDAIWKFAIEAVEPRVVEIWEGYRKPSDDFDDFGSIGPWTGQFTSPCPIPDLLHACPDSRRLALKRWRLRFAHKKQPAKIFFDMTADTLYFGRAFDCPDSFREEGDRADRRALRKIAFHLQQQWDSEYFEAGDDLAVSLHKYFPALREVVFVERDVAYDWERHEAGRAQRRPNPKKTLIAFCPPKRDPGFGHQAVSEITAKYAQRKWTCPKLEHMDYQRSRPSNPKAPTKPSDDAGDMAWEVYYTKMEYAEGEFSSDESFFDDDDDSEVGGWLDEVPDLQTRVVLIANPELRSQFGF